MLIINELKFNIQFKSIFKHYLNDLKDSVLLNKL